MSVCHGPTSPAGWTCEKENRHTGPHGAPSVQAIPWDDKRQFVNAYIENVQVAVTLSVPTAKAEDWRAWANITRQPNECACGINRTDCEYHR